MNNVWKDNLKKILGYKPEFKESDILRCKHKDILDTEVFLLMVSDDEWTIYAVLTDELLSIVDVSQSDIFSKKLLNKNFKDVKLVYSS